MEFFKGEEFQFTFLGAYQEFLVDGDGLQQESAGNNILIIIPYLYNELCVSLSKIVFIIK